MVVGITATGNTNEVGRIGLKALGLFVTASLVALLLGVILANHFQPGANLDLPLPDKGLSTNLKTGAGSARSTTTSHRP